MRHLILLVFFLPFCAVAQLEDDFSDGDFTNNPTWSGDAADFEIDANQELHLNATPQTDESHLSTPINLDLVSEWSFYVRMGFNPSSSNQFDFHLLSDSSNLESDHNGYFVRIGGTNDEVSLFRKDGSSDVKIIDGADDRVNTNEVAIWVTVIRNSNGTWKVASRFDEEPADTIEGVITDLTYSFNGFTGVHCDYTSTRSDLFWFDDFGYNKPPSVLEITVLDSQTIEMSFSEAIDPISGQSLSNFSVNAGIGAPSNITQITDNTLQLRFASTFVNGSNYELTVSAIGDTLGNLLSSQMIPFEYTFFGTPKYRSIVINEILPDPTPVVGLPEEEFVEIYNPSTAAFDLSNAQFGDASDTVSFPQGFMIAPGEYAILCNDDDTALFSGFGNLIPFGSFPALNNTGDDLKLIVDGVLIDHLTYSDDWYNDDDRADGGYTIEQKNPVTPCGGQSNWSASTASIGGTPGTQNSNYDLSPDTTKPEITQIDILTKTQLIISFSEPMDSASLANASFEVVDGPQVSVVLITPSLSSITMVLQGQLDSTQLYPFIYSSTITDCEGNAIVVDTILIGIGVSPEPYDLVINEFYASPDESAEIPAQEFVEVYNRSDKLIRLNGLVFGDASSESEIFSGVLAAGEYAIICDDGFETDFSEYGYVATVTTLPSLNNSDDDIFIAFGEKIIDQVSYTDDWYDGKSGTLERINPDYLCGLNDNWSGTESTLGGTPGAINSVVDAFINQEELEILSAVFVSQNQLELNYNQVVDTADLKRSTITVNGIEANGISLNTGNAGALVAFPSSFSRGETYTVSVDSLKNCAQQNTSAIEFNTYLHLATDVVINEVLFNPRGSGSDFVELYNQSEFDIDLQGWSLAYFDSKDSLRFNPISENPLFLEADGYVALNEDPDDILENYPSATGENFPVMNLPSYPNSEGSVILFDQLGELLEQFDYNEDMHFALIDNADGVSLERLSPQRAASDMENWHSASSTVNYATPGYINSQDYTSSAGVSEFSLSAEYISPDNDGYQDVVNIDYLLNEPGHVASISIYNDRGILIRSLYTNQVLGNSGSLTWDGTNDNGEKARTGIHVILVETFDLDGNLQRSRLPVVVATRL